MSFYYLCRKSAKTLENLNKKCRKYIGDNFFLYYFEYNSQLKIKL